MKVGELQAIFQTCDTMAKIEEIHDEQDNVPPPKINNANLGELKATTDDAIAPVHPFPIPNLQTIPNDAFTL